MVAVVATQELEPGDVLRRFKEEAARDEPRHGNSNNRYRSSARRLEIVAAQGIILACVLVIFFVSLVHARVCVR